MRIFGQHNDLCRSIKLRNSQFGWVFRDVNWVVLSNIQRIFLHESSVVVVLCNQSCKLVVWAGGQVYAYCYGENCEKLIWSVQIYGTQNFFFYFFSLSLGMPKGQVVDTGKNEFCVEEYCVLFPIVNSEVGV